MKIIFPNGAQEDIWCCTFAASRNSIIYLGLVEVLNLTVK